MPLNPIKEVSKKVDKVKYMTGVKKPYMLIVEWLGDKKAKGLKVGYSGLGVGATFGGTEREKLLLKCGKCKTKSNFKVINNEKNIFECDKCGAFNTPNKGDMKFFT